MISIPIWILVESGFHFDTMHKALTWCIIYIAWNLQRVLLQMTDFLVYHLWCSLEQFLSKHDKYVENSKGL